MSSVQWSQTARRDLRAIHDYVARDSLHYARRLVNRIMAGVERIQRFPESGGRVAEWDREDFREVLVGNYRIIYRTYPDRVVILAIIHGARQLPDFAQDVP